ncbi:hypothetical protein CTI12_AA342870 [Artemisia annua]|uniref:Fringe-like glycosyltransferase domain-containing protein n=1 Tax=Artemisia annua TaxID=35608 RepID=A0A2U1MRV7_ARTAN|nr:hypothetical protein CTI12_AA342870 [Artemisia annua]
MTHVKDKLANVFHLRNNEAIIRSLKLTLLIFVIISISVIALSRRYPAPGCLISKNYQNTLDTIARAPDSSPEASDLPTDISHVLFGIGGSVHTWEERRRYSELWWQPGRTRGFVWLDENPDMKLFSDPNSPPFKVSESLARLKNVGSGPAVRIARIVLESFRLRLPDVRWFVMGDDDTVFFPDNLISVLSKYDHRKMYYIGGSSESGTRCNAFMDVRGDAYGLLAAHPMTPLVSLHHLDYIKPLIPNRTKYESLNTLIKTYRLDPPRTMQQSFCFYNHWWHRWSMSVSWGYTVQIYPLPLTANELQMPLQTFLTWRSFTDGPFTFNTRPLSSNPCEAPAIFYISQVRDVGNETVTTYKRDESTKKCKKGDYPHSIESVVVLASKMDPNYWTEGPRRQCCEIRGWKYNRMEVRLHEKARVLCLARHNHFPYVDDQENYKNVRLYPGLRRKEKILFKCNRQRYRW